MQFLLLDLKSLQLCLTLCNPMDHSAPGSSAHGILQAIILEWVAMHSPPGDLSNSGIEPVSLGLLHREVGSLPIAPTGKTLRFKDNYELSNPAAFNRF